MVFMSTVCEIQTNKTYFWSFNGEILCVCVAKSEADAWESLKNTDIGLYDQFSRGDVTRPSQLENGCFCVKNGY